jgi:hypothetical protein
MGAWGSGSFENDDAVDWVGGLSDSKNLAPVKAAIDAVAKATGYIEAPDCSTAIAAAEVVAAMRGHAMTGLPPEVVTFVTRRLPVDAGLINAAKKAVSRVLDDSELRALWEEGPDFKAWSDGLRGLLQRLNT